MSWQPIETAPKDGTHIDLWAKCWIPDTDTFIYSRIPNSYWRKADSQGGWKASWAVGRDWHPTHWMPIPPGPDEGETR